MYHSASFIAVQAFSHCELEPVAGLSEKLRERPGGIHERVLEEVYERQDGQFMAFHKP
jgi:hypothetical protein